MSLKIVTCKNELFKLVFLIDFCKVHEVKPSEVGFMADTEIKCRYSMYLYIVLCQP